MMRMISALIVATFVLNAVTAVAAPVELKFGVFVSPRGISVKQIFEPWAKWVHEQVGDEVKIKIFAGGILGRNPVQQMKLVKDGVQDITFAVPTYTPARFVDLSLLQLPGLVHNSMEGSLAIWRMYEKGLIRGFEDVKLVGLFTLEPFGLHTAKPIRSYGDVKGMKLRSGGKIHNDIVKALGAVPVGMPVTRIAENMSRNLIEGGIIPWTSLRPFRIDQIAKYHYNADLGVLPLVVAMNKGRYEKLPPKAKAVIDKSGPMLSKLQGAVFDAARTRYVKQYTAYPKHKVLNPTAAEQQEMAALFKPLHKKWKAEHGTERYDVFVEIFAAIRKGS